MKSSRSHVGQIIFFITLTIGSFLLLLSQPRFFIPFGWTLVLFLVFSPTYRFFLRLKIGPTLSSFAVIGMVVAMTVVPIFKIAPLLSVDSSDLKEKIPAMEKMIKNSIEFVDSKIAIPGIKDLGKNGIEKIVYWTKSEAEALIVEIPTLLGMILEWIFIIPLTLFFLFRDGDKLKSYYFKLIPNSFFERFYGLVYKFNRHLGDYIFAKFFEAMIVGVLITVGLLVLNVPYPIFLGIIAGVTNVIPYLGPILGSLPGIIIVLLEQGTFDQKVGLVSLVFVITNIIDMGVIFPVLVSRIVNLHPFVVIVSVILGGQMFGVAGMIMSIPLTTAIKLLFYEFYREMYPGGGTITHVSD